MRCCTTTCGAKYVHIYYFGNSEVAKALQMNECVDASRLKSGENRENFNVARLSIILGRVE